MIKEVKSYSIVCDNCGKTYVENCNDYTIWLEPDIAIQNAMDEDWIEHEGKHYCPDCYKIGEYGNIEVKESEASNE